MYRNTSFSAVIVALGVALTLGAGSAMGTLVLGQGIGVDIGDSGNTAGAGAELNFNVFASANGTVAAGSVIDTTGAIVSDVSITTADWARSGDPGLMGESDIGYGATGNDYTGSPFSDLSFNDGTWHTPDSQTDWPMGTVTFAGLDDGLTYELQVVGGRLTGAPGFTVDADGQSVYKTFADIRNGSGPIAPLMLTGLSTDGAGSLVVTIHEPDQYIGVNALYLEAIPEPSTLAIFGLGFGLVAVLRRRIRG